MFAKLRDKIFEKARESQLIRRVYSSIFHSYEWEWNLSTRGRKSAIWGILNVEDEETFDKRGNEFAEELKKFIEPNSVVLDVGCGIGRVEKFLALYCKEIHGVDVSGKMIKLAKNRINHKNAYFHKNNGRDLSIFPDDAFNFIFSEAVFQHIEKEDACFYLMEIHRVLKEKGKAYLQFPNILCDYNLDGFLSSAKNKYRSSIRMRYYTPIEIERIAKGIGFKILSLETKSDWRDVDGSCRHDRYYRGYSIWLLVLR
jgi:ubiquinone/menaquinone biosynthesis C-methylase UbiE